MRAIDLPVPGAVLGRYPQRSYVRPSSIERAQRHLARLRLPLWREAAGSRRAFVAAVHAAQASLPAPGSDAFARAVHRLRAELGRSGLQGAMLPRAFALVRSACAHVTGVALYDTQLIAARVMLDDRLAEMATGEGKTHAAMLAAAVAALGGVPVHLITANDYLAGRDAASLEPVYRFLGLSVGCVLPGMDAGERRRAYACDVAYCTAKELIFDYLRDRSAGTLARGELRRRLRGQAEDPAAATPVLRGLCLALIDEADSVLLDEARTPFVLAQQRHDPGEARMHRVALDLAGSLEPDGTFFRVHLPSRSVELTQAGRRRVAAAAHMLEGAWRHRRFREELVELALTALHLYRRDLDYVVRDGRVEIVDPNTGRVAVGRIWSRGLHQLIELKEGCEPSPVQRTIAQLTFQRFFPRYLKLGGMSGTLCEARGELLGIYGLDVEAVPLRTPGRRRELPLRVFATARQRLRATVLSIRDHHAQGRPVLVGTDSVADSERLSRYLRRLRLEHRVLNARQDADEARLVAEAGEPGRITVATNMAGRGTDIRLAPAAAAAGGLHVISCQQNAARRIDRQLHGRAGRQGDPGSVETLLSLHEGLLARHLTPQFRLALQCACAGRGELPGFLAAALVRRVQRSEERRAWRDRARVMRHDEEMERRLGFGGPGE